MKIKVLIVKPGKDPYVSDIDNGLKSMQKIVGGYIQAIHPFGDTNVALVCNEEGKLSNLPTNRFLFHPKTGVPVDVIAGTFFLCACNGESEEFESLNEEQIQKYTKKFSSTW